MVSDVAAEGGFLAKKVRITAADGRTFVFNRGVMSTAPILTALQRS